MTEKKEHHLTKAKRLREEAEAKKVVDITETVETVIEKPVEKKTEKKTSWTVVWVENGIDREFTYYAETPEAEVNAAKLALKKGGKVI